MDNLSYVCLVFVILSRLLIAALWSPAGEGLVSCLLFVMYNCVFVTFQWASLGQKWHLIVSIPDLCHLSCFETHNPLDLESSTLPLKHYPSQYSLQCVSSHILLN